MFNLNEVRVLSTIYNIAKAMRYHYKISLCCADVIALNPFHG